MRLRLGLALPAALALSVTAAAAGTGTCVERLPAGATVIGAADLATIRASKVVDRAAWDAAPGPAVLERAGIRFRSDVDELALAMLPAAGPDKPQDFVAVMAGRFDRAKVRAGLVAQGGKAEQLGNIPVVRMPAGGSFAVHPALPSLEAPGSLLVSFAGDLLVVGTDRGTRGAHGPKEGVPTPALAAARQSVPPGAALWISADLPPAGAASGPLAMASGLQRVTAWGLFGDALELKALAKAADSKSAAQLAAIATLLVGATASQPEMKSLGGVKVAAQSDTLTASLTLTPAQIREMTGGGL